MSHYTHHIDDSGKEEPTVIEIKGEPYPEELDPELHEFNRLTKRIADLALAYRNSRSGAVMFCWLDLKEALDEYEKMVSSEAGEAGE